MKANRFLFSSITLVILLSGCGSKSSKKGAVVAPPSPPISSNEVLKETCKNKISTYASLKENTSLSNFPSPLKSESFYVALAVNSGQLDPKCLDFEYE